MSKISSFLQKNYEACKETGKCDSCTGIKTAREIAVESTKMSDLADKDVKTTHKYIQWIEGNCALKNKERYDDSISSDKECK